MVIGVYVGVELVDVEDLDAIVRVSLWHRCWD
jgi:hypothetical protein